ncbi:MAG TPA: cytochrome C [Rhodocyclaceae bacterium]
MKPQNDFRRRCGLLLVAALMALPALAAQDTARNLAATCTGCHGTDGYARPGMPALAGRPAEGLLQLLAEFRSGARPSTIMQQIAKGYSEEQLRLIAGYFASRPAAPGAGS